jgi:hypothetical protein
MREGRGLNHPGYAFLSFYRVLEVAFPNGRARGEWITRRLSTISDRRAKEALAELASQGIADIGAHLYVSGRRAMAHARDEPIIDPDDPADARRLSSELPIMSSLATLAIEEVFGVETRHAVYEKHLYELAGFKKVLGTDLVKRITSGAPIAPGTIIDLPRINVRLRLHPPFAPLENLHPVEIHQNKSVLFVRFQSDDRNLQIQFHLDFASERLQFNMFHDVAMRDSGTADGALALLGFGRFRNAHFCNGQLEIYDAESNALLARKDAYVPLNMYFEPKGAEEEIARLEKLAEERRRWEVGSVFVAARGEIKSTHRSFETYGIRVRLDIE